MVISRYVSLFSAHNMMISYPEQFGLSVLPEDTITNITQTGLSLAFQNNQTDAGSEC